jgi:hypothetical protein
MIPNLFLDRISSQEQMELVQAYMKEFTAGSVLRDASGPPIYKPGVPKARRATAQAAQQRQLIDSMSERARKELELCLKVQRMLLSECVT